MRGTSRKINDRPNQMTNIINFFFATKSLLPYSAVSLFQSQSLFRSIRYESVRIEISIALYQTTNKERIKQKWKTKQNQNQKQTKQNKHKIKQKLVIWMDLIVVFVIICDKLYIVIGV